MSKASRRMMKQRNRQASAKAKEVQKNAQQLTEMEAKDLQHLFETEQYADYINRLAEIVQEGHYDEDALYRGAYSYFMLGDYLRAANMVNDVLTVSPMHLEARILLARICLLDDRTDDGLAIFDFILEHFKEQLTEAQTDDLKDVLDYYANTETENIRKNFPHVVRFLQAAGLMPEIAAAEVQDAPQAETAAIECAPVPETVEAVEAEAEEPSLDSAAASESAAPDAAAEIAQVMAQQISLADKVRLLNAFAAAHFMAGAAEYAAAREELEQALQLDTASAETLRNLAVLAKCQEEAEKAWAFAAKLPTSDFLLMAFLGK